MLPHFEKLWIFCAKCILRKIIKFIRQIQEFTKDIFNFMKKGKHVLIKSILFWTKFG